MFTFPNKCIDWILFTPLTNEEAESQRELVIDRAQAYYAGYHPNKDKFTNVA